MRSTNVSTANPIAQAARFRPSIRPRADSTLPVLSSATRCIPPLSARTAAPWDTLQ